MNRTSTKTGKGIIGQILKSTKKNFLETCQKIFELFIKDIYIDQESNVIVLSSNTIFYCISTDKKELEGKNIKYKSFCKLLEQYKDINHVIILYNRNLIDTGVRAKSKELLLKIAHNYNIRIEAYTPNSLVEYIFSQSRTMLYENINEANKKFKIEYQNRMSQENVYIENIPYHENDIPKNNPKQNLQNHFIDDSPSKSWIFVKSEFGFGKTSLLLNLPEKQSFYKYIYLPISLFDVGSFSNETTLAQSILSIIFNRELDTKNSLIDKILVTEFRQLLRFQKEIVLLYDGLDEHHLSYTEKGLKQIFSCATSFVCNSIFTVRKEFVDERSGTFSDALEVSYRPKIFEVDLLEWKNENILDYINTIKNKIVLKPKEISYLEQFKGLIKNNKYEEIYGDIPKRPLFLKMLIDDILCGEIEIKNISELYESYLIKKFKIDREGSSYLAVSSRPLSLNGDRNSKIDYIFELLSKVAWHMIEVEGVNVIYSEYIEEQNINELIKQEYEEFNELIELLMNSVLIPFGKRGQRSFNAKFAHKSFHEYFVAYYLIYYKLGDLNDISPFTLCYSNGTITFCKYIIENENLQEKIDALYIKLPIQIQNSFLYRLATIEAHEIKYQNNSTINQDKELSEYDFFISHASEDKIPFVENLVKSLSLLGLKIFYDKDSIGISEDIVSNINFGFKNLKYGVITILSPEFIKKPWCNEELSISYSLKVENKMKLIPIYLNIDIDDLKSVYPILRTIKMVDAKLSTSAIANQIKSLTK